MYMKHIFGKPCLKQDAFLVDPLGVSNDFSNFDVFWPLQKEAQTKKRARNLAPASNVRSPGPPKGAHPDPKGGQKGSHSEFWETKRAPGLSSHPVFKRVAGNVGCSRLARWLRIVKFSCVGPRIHLVLQILNLSQELTHSGRVPLLRCTDNSSSLNCLALLVSSQQILRNSWMSWQFLARCSWKILCLISYSL